VPGRPATDQQMRMYMKFRHHDSQLIAAAKTGISERTGRRIERDPRLPSQKAAERPLRRQSPTRSAACGRPTSCRCSPPVRACGR